jgi:murein DD-endopeptidase MepM/ murein hydrolase activator NlpD
VWYSSALGPEPSQAFALSLDFDQERRSLIADAAAIFRGVGKGMRGRRYTVLVADRSSGVVRRFTISLRATLSIAASIFMLPVLIGLGAEWSARGEIGQLQTTTSTLQIENGNFRATTGELTTQIQALEGVIDDLGARAALDPEQARAMQKLPAIVKSKAAGGNAQTNAAIADVVSSLTSSPEDTFGVLKSVLQGLESRLRYVRHDVEQREKLAAATPSMWPAHGWITGYFGGRADPFTGEMGFHQGIDLSTEKGSPVFATADGTVQSAGYSGDYGNLIVLRHDFDLSTRYAHLSGFNVKAGQSVKRGDVIGYVGSTGRSTGAHLHYEILSNGKLLDPLQLLTRPDSHN